MELRIETPPKVLVRKKPSSKSHSKQKWSPYLKADQKLKFDKLGKDRKINQLVLNNHVYIQGQIRKLKIEHTQPCSKNHNTPEEEYIQSKNNKQLQESEMHKLSRYHRWIELEQVNSYNSIMKKLDQQSQELKQSIEKIRRPSHQYHPPNNYPQLIGDPSLWEEQDILRKEIQRIQKINIKQLKQITAQNQQIYHLQSQIEQIQTEITKKNIKVYQLEQKCREFQVELERQCQYNLQLKKCVDEIEKQTQQRQLTSKNHNEELILQVVKSSQVKNKGNSSTISSKINQPQKNKTSLNDLEMFSEGEANTKLSIEYNKLQMQNQIMFEEINLLNYSLEEKAKEIQKLQSMIQKYKQISNHRSDDSNTKQGLNQSKNKAKTLKFSDTNEHYCGDSPRSYKSYSILPKGSQKDNIGVNRKNQQRDHNIEKQFQGKSFMSKTFSRQSLPQETISHENPSIVESITLSKDQSMKKSVAQMDDQERIKQAKKYLRGTKRKSSLLGLDSKQLLKKQYSKSSYFFVKQRFTKLESIRSNLTAKFKGFNYTLKDFQADIIRTYEYELSKEEIHGVLKGFPFFLKDELINEILEYMFRNQELIQVINSDSFCNCMREFIADYPAVNEQEELMILNSIKQKLYISFESIKEELDGLKTKPGLISEAVFKEVLEEYSFLSCEIEYLICQCCIVSDDLENLAYEQYFEIFQLDS